MNITIRQLKAFVAVTRLSSFTEAANELSVTPSALSAIIRELESTVDLRLLERSTRQVALSDAGQEFLPRAKQVLQELENAKRCVLDLRQHRRGVVRIVATQVMFWTLLPPLFAAFRQANPGIILIPVEVPVEGVIDALEKGKADVAIFSERRSKSELSMRHIFDTSPHLLCHRAHRFAARDSITWGEIADDPLIFIGTEAKTKFQIELNSAYEFAEASSTASGTTAIGMVSAELGAAVMLGIIRPVVEPLGLRLIPLVEPVLTRRMMLYSHSRKLASKAVEHFCDFAVDYMQSSR
ncbi:MAG: LysR family transcriptional regulator [Comamonadaceae bacterium]|nr:LysR family transcriptional regulator [Comamonadaceae bacterium]